MNSLRTRSIICVRKRFWCRSKAGVSGFRSAVKLLTYENYRPFSRGPYVLRIFHFQIFFPETFARAYLLFGPTFCSGVVGHMNIKMWTRYDFKYSSIVQLPPKKNTPEQKFLKKMMIKKERRVNNSAAEKISLIFIIYCLI